MNEQLRDQTSAFLDDELPPAESELLVRRVGRDEAIHATAIRYLLVGQALRGELLGDRPLAFVEQVRARIDAEGDEAEHSSTELELATDAAPRAPARWWRPASGAAAAAAVALLAIVGLQNANRSQLPEAPAFAATPEVAPVAPVAPASRSPEPAARPVAVQAPIRLTNYLMTHGEVAGTLGRKTIHSGIVGSSAAEIMGAGPESDAVDLQVD